MEYNSEENKENNDINKKLGVNFTEPTYRAINRKLIKTISNIRGIDKLKLKYFDSERVDNEIRRERKKYPKIKTQQRSLGG